MESAVTVLPHPLSPTTASVLPAVDRKADAIDCFRVTGVGVEVRAQVATSRSGGRTVTSRSAACVAWESVGGVIGSVTR